LEYCTKSFWRKPTRVHHILPNQLNVKTHRSQNKKKTNDLIDTSKSPLQKLILKMFEESLKSSATRIESFKKPNTYGNAPLDECTLRVTGNR